MKKTLKINISGIVFQIDEDAYELLKKYLDAVSRKFGSSPEGKEILGDIEQRIAELLLARTGVQKEVVTIDDVNEVMHTMGNPEDFAEETPAGGEAGQKSREEEEDYSHERRRNRRLYRDPDNSVLGGICSGLGAYFNTDPVIFRILFVVFVFAWGITAVAYLLMWIIVPPARTAAQKLEMRGESVTIENIERSVREEFEAVKKSAGKLGRSETYSGVRTALGEMFHVLGLLIKGLARIILIFVGVVLILIGFGLLLGLLSAVVLHQTFISDIFTDSNVDLSQLSGLIFTHSDFQWIVLTLALVIGIPLIALIYGGIKMLFRFKARDKAVGLSLFLLWVISAITLTWMVVIDVQNFTSHEETDSRTALKSFRNKTLVLDVAPGKIDSLKKACSYFEKDEVRIYFNPGKHEYYGSPWLRIERADSTEASLMVEKGAQGLDRSRASEYANGISYHWIQNDTAIIFDPVYTAPKGQAWRAPHVTLELRVPEGTKLVFSPRMKEVLEEAEPDNWDEWSANIHNMRYDMPGKSFVMGKNGLREFNK